MDGGSSRNADGENPPGKGSPGPQPCSPLSLEAQLSPGILQRTSRSQSKGERTQKSRPKTQSRAVDHQDPAIGNYTQGLSTELVFSSQGQCTKFGTKRRCTATSAPEAAWQTH